MLEAIFSFIRAHPILCEPAIIWLGILITALVTVMLILFIQILREKLSVVKVQNQSDNNIITEKDFYPETYIDISYLDGDREISDMRNIKGFEGFDEFFPSNSKKGELVTHVWLELDNAFKDPEIFIHALDGQKLIRKKIYLIIKEPVRHEFVTYMCLKIEGEIDIQNSKYRIHFEETNKGSRESPY